MPARTQTARFQLLAHVCFLIVGAAVLGISMNQPVGSPLFYLLTSLLAVIWLFATWLTGELHSLRLRASRSELSFGLGAGIVLALVFISGAFVMQLIPWLRDPVIELLRNAAGNALPLVTFITIVTGAAEEVYFRGALFQAASKPSNSRSVSAHRAVWISAGAYTAVTAASGIILLTLAAAMLGLITALVRVRCKTILPCVMTHLIWSLTMLYVLPLIIQGLRY